jgi:hypothetical protein
MSGGSFNYTCFRVENEYSGRMQDEELNEMLVDFCEVLHDLEWWQSCDISEEQYRETVAKFKNKWFSERDKETKAAIKRILKKISNEIESL